MTRYEPGRVWIRRMSTNRWTALNPILGDGELGYDTDTGALKVGDGHTNWSDLTTFAGPKGDKGDQGDTGQDGALTLSLADSSLVNTGTSTNPVLKVGDLSGTYATKTAVDNLSAQQAQLMGVAATIDELTATAVIQGEWSGSTWQRTQGSSDTGRLTTFWVAPFACTVASAVLITDYATVAASSSNYVTFALFNVSAGTTSQIVSKTTNDEALTARTAWSFANSTWDTDAAVLAAGEAVGISIAVTGSATLTYPVTITVQVQPSSSS